MDNPGEILRLCRLCLVKDQVNIPIFEEQGDIRQIFLKISSCLPVKVSRDDQLPKKICDGCLNKLDLLYEFWNTSVNAEKTLLSWLGQAGVKDADEKISAVAQQIAKSAETQVKQEALEDGHAPEVQSFEEEAKDESEAPPPKRARRTAAVKAQINITPESDDDDDMDSAEAMTKVEDESDESDGEDKDPSYGEVPGTSADDQAGPSGVGKDGVEAPFSEQDQSENKPSNSGSEDAFSGIENNNQNSFCGNIMEQSAKYINFDKNDKENNGVKNKDQYEEDINNDVEEELAEFNVVDEVDSDDNNEVSTILTILPNIYCEKCGKVFDSIRKLHQHITELSTQHSFKCEICGKKCTQISLLSKHIKLSHRREIKELDKKYTSKNRDDKNYYCSKCGAGFPGLYLLDEHEEKSAHKTELLPCLECEKVFVDSSILFTHFLCHISSTAVYLKCRRCRIEINTPKGYIDHMKTKHKKRDVSFSCSHCDKHFSDYNSYKGHIDSHEFVMIQTRRGVVEKKAVNICQFCPETLSRKSELIKHVNKYHLKFISGRIKCRVCDSMMLLSSYQDHLLKHKQKAQEGKELQLENFEGGN